MRSAQEYAQARRQERVGHAAFVREFADERYRALQRLLLDDFHTMNTEFFGSKLIEPHLDFAYTPPRSLVTCKDTDGSGGSLLITLNETLVFGTHPGVRRPYPSEGATLLLRDLARNGFLDQYVREALSEEDRELHSHDALLAREARLIGISMRLAAVFDRNRPGKPRRPLAKYWPSCVRPQGYYRGDIDEGLENIVRGIISPQRPLTTPSLGVLEFIHYLLARGRAQDAQNLLDRHLAWLRMFGSGRRRRIAKPPDGLEEMRLDTDGSPLGKVCFDQAWTAWNGGTVDLIARSIQRHRTYVDLPVLADALEEAGCTEGKLLRHLRAQVAHGKTCWALRFVLSLDEDDSCSEAENA